MSQNKAINFNNRVTYIDQVMKDKKKVPGPSSYKPNYPKNGSKM